MVHLLRVVPVGGDALREVGVAEHYVPHKLLGLDVWSQHIRLLLPGRRVVRRLLKIVVDTLQCLAKILVAAAGVLVPERLQNVGEEKITSTKVNQ